MKFLTSCTSFETAHVTQNYPWGYTLKTERRTWIEFRKGFGLRLAYATLNPKTHRWCAPKYSTYNSRMVLFIVEETDQNKTDHEGKSTVGYIRHDGLSQYPTEEMAKAFYAKYPKEVIFGDPHFVA